MIVTRAFLTPRREEGSRAKTQRRQGKSFSVRKRGDTLIGNGRISKNRGAFAVQSLKIVHFLEDSSR
jgi:hypothetical protein